MGKKLDALLGRTFKTSKFKNLVNLAISRLAVLKNHRQVRCTQARSDVTQLLKLGQQDRALLRVEQVMKEQNMLDVFIMIEGYCHVLLERVVLIENNKACPSELDEAISSLIFAASRCGEFPELQEIRWLFTSRFGKEYASRAIELRNGCGVNHKMMQKLSTRHPSLESRMKVLKEIASENGIILQLEEEAPVITNDNMEMNRKQNRPENDPPPVNLDRQETAEIDGDEQFSGSMKARKYRDVASAAQAAFESAAYAAEAARAAVELSRSESLDKGSDDDQDKPNTQMRNRSDESRTSKLGTPRAENTGSGEAGLEFQKFQPIYNSSSESEDELPQSHREYYSQEANGRKTKNKKLQRSLSDSSQDSDGETNSETKIYSNGLNRRGPSEEMVFDESDNETRNEKGSFPRKMHSGLSTEKKTSFSTDEYLNTKQTNNPYMKSGEQVSDQRLNLNRTPISVRTKRGNGW